MTDFEKMLTPAENKESNNFNSNNNYKKEKSFFKKSEHNNVEGKTELNLWNNDRVIPMDIDNENILRGGKTVTLVLPNKYYELDEDNLELFKSVLKVLKAKGYKVRFVCNFIKAIYKIVNEVFEDEDIIRITAWKSYCKTEKKLKLYVISDDNIKAAARVINKFDTFPAGIKYMKSAVIASLLGTDNKSASTFILTHDSKYDGKTIDFKTSADIFDYALLAKRFNIPFFNLAKEEQLEDLKKILS